MSSQGSSLFDSWNNFGLYGAGSAAPKRGPQVHPRHFHLEDVSTKGQGCNHTLLASSCDCEELWLPRDACCSGCGARSHTAQGWPTRHFLEPRLGADFFHLQIIMIRLIYCRPNTFLGLSGPHSSKHGRTKSLDRLWKSCKKMSCNWGCMLKA